MKKGLLAVSLAVLLSGCFESGVKNSTSEKLVRFETGGKYGLVNAKGEIVV